MKLKIRHRLDWGSVLSSSVVMLNTDCCGNPRLVALIGDVSNEVVVFGCAVLIAFHWINVCMSENMGDGLNEHFLLCQSKLFYGLRLGGAEKLNIPLN